MYKDNKYRSSFMIFLVVLLCHATAASNDWPFWRGPNRNGISDENGWNPRTLEGGAKILWKINVGEGL